MFWGVLCTSSCGRSYTSFVVEFLQIATSCISSELWGSLFWETFTPITKLVELLPHSVVTHTLQNILVTHHSTLILFVTKLVEFLPHSVETHNQPQYFDTVCYKVEFLPHSVVTHTLQNNILVTHHSTLKMFVTQLVEFLPHHVVRYTLQNIGIHHITFFLTHHSTLWRNSASGTPTWCCMAYSSKHTILISFH